jgi:hypothetical protein
MKTAFLGSHTYSISIFIALNRNHKKQLKYRKLYFIKVLRFVLYTLVHDNTFYFLKNLINGCNHFNVLYVLLN